MGFFEAFRTAWNSLRANKLRSSLTLLGMVIGIFAIIASVTAVDVIDVYFQESLNLLGSSTFAVSRDKAIRFNEERDRTRRDLTYEQMLRLEDRITLPLTLSPSDGFGMSAVRYGGRETEMNVSVVGSNEHYPLHYGYDIEDGRGLTGEDVLYARAVVLLGSAVAEHLFPTENPLGKEVRIRGRWFQVVGVFASKGSFLGMSWDNRVVAPITTLHNYFGGRTGNLSSISVRASSPREIPAAMEHVIGHMRVIRKVPPGKDNDFEIETNNSLQGTFDSFTSTLTLAGAGIGLISLLAAGIGIMNIMLVSVTERTREIGLRKSVGARRRDIMRQFLFEAFFLCQIGGMIGILLGGLFGNLTALYFDISAAFPVRWAVGGVAMVTVVAVLFGVYPASKAARLNPIESLRHE